MNIRLISEVLEITRRLDLRLRCCLFLPLGLLILGGCANRASLHDSVYADRTGAYDRWRQSRADERESAPELSGELTLQDAVKIALSYNKSLMAMIQEKDVARGRVIASYSEALPRVSGVAGYTRLDETSGFNVGGQSISIGALDNYSADLHVRQPLFRGGAIRSALQSARIFSYLTDESVRGQVQATIFKVANTYYSTLLARHLYEVNRDAVMSAEAHLKDVRAKFDQDMASRFDILRAEVDVSNFKAEMIQQHNRLNLAKTSLLKAMGVSQETEISLADDLVYEPMFPVLEEAVRIAHLNRPDLYRAELNLRLQEEAVRIARSQYWPRIDAVFTQGWARPDPHTSQDSWGDRWTAGVQFELPVFDGLGREGRLIQEKAMLERKGIESLEAEENALVEIQQSLLALRDAEEFVESQRLNLIRAAEGLRLAEAGYREGINTEVEVVDARSALTRARGLHYQAVYNHTIARLSLQRAMGILGPRAGDRTVSREPPVEPARIEEFQADPAGDSDTAAHSVEENREVD